VLAWREKKGENRIGYASAGPASYSFELPDPRKIVE
jgi:hypothetical protein